MTEVRTKQQCVYSTRPVIPLASMHAGKAGTRDVRGEADGSAPSALE